jgi:hypothetical protein
MSKLARQLSVCCAVFGALGTVSSASAARLDYYLTIDNVNHTWELAASTDSPGGIGAIVVDLILPGFGQCVAPRGIKGFTVYGLHYATASGGVQAFAGQVPFDVSNIVYGVGYAPVADSEFGVLPPLVEMVGSAHSVPTVFYHGWYDPSSSWLPSFHPIQPILGGSVYVSPPPPGGYEKPVVPSEITRTPEIVTFNTLVVPEPSALLIGSFGFSLCSIIVLYGHRKRTAAM